MSNKVTDRARVYVRFCCHFSLAGAWYPLPVLFQSKRPTVWPLRGMGAEGMGDFREKKSCRLISRGKNNSCKEMPGQKEFLPWRKKKSFRAAAGKKSYPHVCQEKTIPRGLGKNVPPPPTLLLPKANGQPLSIKPQLGRFIPGNGKWNSYRWSRWTKRDRDDRGNRSDWGSRGDSTGVKPHHCFVTITNIKRISSQNLSMYQ